MSSTDDQRVAALRELIGRLPKSPGVYLFKDAQGRVLYVGKAKDLRSRVASYFQPGARLAASRGPDIERMSRQVTDIDFLDCPSEVDALLQENRLIKDIQPPFNAELRDGKTFPYIEITTREDFPGVYITREPSHRGTKLYGPFVEPSGLRQAIDALQPIFKFRTCKLDLRADDDRRRFFRPCLLHAIKRCTGPCADLVSREAYRENIGRLRRFLESKRAPLLRQMTRQMEAAAAERRYEEAAVLRDQIQAIESLAKSGRVAVDVQPELFFVDPAEGLERLATLLALPDPPRIIEGIDIATLGGTESCGSLVCFIDGRPFKNGYRRFRIKTVEGVDDFAMVAEVIRRRYRHAGEGEELYPDVILIDGGKGQLHAALDAFDELAVHPPMVISIAKREEEIFVQDRPQPLRLRRNDPALRLIQQVRDEAHRFVQHYHHILRRKKTFDQQSDGADGVE